MKYIKWALLAALDVLFNIVCYLTNPVVLLFADEVGNLPWLFRWWENWDDQVLLPSFFLWEKNEC